MEPGRIATLSLAFICGTVSRALRDSFDYTGTQFPVPLAPSILGHCKFELQLPQKFNSPALLYTSRDLKDNKKLSTSDHLKEWQSCPNLYEKPHRNVKIRLCTTTSQYGKRGADEKRNLGLKRNLYEKTRLSKTIRSQKRMLPYEEMSPRKCQLGYTGTHSPYGPHPSLPSYLLEEYLDHCLVFEDMTPIEANSFRDMFQKTDCTDKYQKEALKELLTYREKNLALTWVTENIAQDKAPISPLLLSFVPVTESPN